jgi:hypothetical protein
VSPSGVNRMCLVVLQDVLQDVSGHNMVVLGSASAIRVIARQVCDWGQWGLGGVGDQGVLVEGLG